MPFNLVQIGALNNIDVNALYSFGFGDYEDLTTKTTATTYNIPQVETNQNNSVFEISISNSEYYLIENRQAVGF